MPILVSGSLAYDHIMDFPDKFKNHILPESIHILNVCFTVEKMEKSRGGTAGSIAHNLKLLGAEPLIFSSLGKDGQKYLESFKKRKISTNFININKKMYTASCFVTTDQDDNQIIAFYNGALGSGLNINLKKMPVKPEWAIISPTKKEVMLRHLKQCAGSDIKIIFDPGQQIPAFTAKELKNAISHADILVGNDYENKMIEKMTGWDEKNILKKTKILITTLGGRGSLIKTSQKEEIRVEACKPKKIVDPTGAGDAYRAGFLLGLDKGYNLRQCGRLGSVAASFALEKYGTQEHRFSAKDFIDRYQKTYKERVML